MFVDRNLSSFLPRHPPQHACASHTTRPSMMLHTLAFILPHPPFPQQYFPLAASLFAPLPVDIPLQPAQRALTSLYQLLSHAMAHAFQSSPHLTLACITAAAAVRPPHHRLLPLLPPANDAAGHPSPYLPSDAISVVQ
jgi:hypothetical protein